MALCRPLKEVLGSPRGSKDVTLRTAGLADEVPVKDSAGQCRFIMCFPCLFQPLLSWAIWENTKGFWEFA